jgi:hypothetical protein
MSASLPTIPKQTQISLNYWNATTAVDGCEFETVFQEPLWVKAGDSINVRNSSLDTSKLSNDNIIIEEDTYLVFEWITYAMLKKPTMDLQNASNDGSFHDAWIYGKDRKAFFNSINSGFPPNTLSVNSVVAGTTYSPDPNALGENDTVAVGNIPPFFFWYLINPLLQQIEPANMTVGDKYQIIENTTQTIFFTSPTDWVYLPQNIFTNTVPFSIPQTGVLTPASFNFGQGSFNVYDGTSFTPLGNIGEFTPQFAVSLSNGGENTNPYPFAPIFNASASNITLQANAGEWSSHATMYVSVYSPIDFLTNNTFWFFLNQANGDYNNKVILNMTACIPPVGLVNPTPPLALFEWAYPPRITTFNLDPFVASVSGFPNTEQADAYATSALVFESNTGASDYFEGYDMGVFVNPLYSYVVQSMAGDEYTGLLPENRFIIANPITLGEDPDIPSPLLTTAGGWNTGSTYPNACGMNTPIILVDGKSLEPITRSTSIVVKAGNYTKAELAVLITRQLADLQTPNSSVNYNSFINKPPYEFQQNQISLINSGCPIELQQSAGGGAGGSFGLYMTYQGFTESAVNPFQCEIAMGASLLNADNINAYSNYIPSFHFPNLNPPVITPEPTPAPTPYVKTIPWFMMTNGVINNTNYFDAYGSKPANIPVCFVPLCSQFQVIGNNANMLNQNPDKNDWYVGVGGGPNGLAWINSTAVEGDDYASGFNNTFDTNEPTTFIGATPLPSPYLAYQTGTTKTGQDTILPCIMNLDAYWNYSGGVWGTNEFSVLYDDTKDQFSLNFLHTPIITNSVGQPTPTVVRSRTNATNPYTNEDVFIQFNSFGLNETNGEKRSDVNERHSGIILTGLTSHIGSVQGKNAGFWERLGFNINDVVLPAKDLKIRELPYETFLKYTTGELYSISQDVNVLNFNANRNNEQMVIPDTFTQWMNPQPQTYTAPAVAPPPPAGFNTDVLYASTAESNLIAVNQPTSVLDELAGNILIEIVGYGTGSELQDVDAFAIKSIVSLFYLTGNTFLSSTGDSYTYYHQSTIPQRISKLKVRLLNPITKKKLTNLLGKNNSVYITITQNQTITMEGALPATPVPPTEKADKGSEHQAK